MGKTSERRSNGGWLLRGAVAAAVVAITAAFSGEALASKAYGYTLLAAGYTDGCAACHDDNAPVGGFGTANKPFAKTMKGLGLTGNGDNEFFVMLVQEELDDYDTDCDGVTDYDEIMNNGDVNDPAAVPAGSTAMFMAGCNDETDTTDTSGDTSSTSADTTSTSADTSSGNASAPGGDESDAGSEGTSCTVASRIRNAPAGLVAVALLFGFAVWRRRAR